MPAKRLFGIISIIFLFVTCISCKSSTDLSEEKRILVIQSYEKHFPAYAFSGGEKAVFADRFGLLPPTACFSQLLAESYPPEAQKRTC